MAESSYFSPREESLDRQGIEALQRQKFARMLESILPGNSFYRRKLEGIRFDPLLDPLAALPFTTRLELEQDQLEHPPYGTNLSFPRDQYCRLHQTSGSGGRPLRWLDTAENWDWWKKCWGIIFSAAGLTAEDKLAFPFSFGPFVGFWGAFDAAVSQGRFVVAAGGMATTARLRMILENRITVICCTPTYALRMIEAAAEEGFDIANSAVRAFIVAGEPGGHIPATRQKIEAAWNARVFDHTGMTEIGPLGFECLENPADVHLMESECIVEVIDPQLLQPVKDGEAGELVITNLGRIGSPVIRYRTGDQVRLTRERCACGRWAARMLGGILGRMDDMFIVRGNNVFPSAIEAVIRRFAEVAEFGVEVRQNGSLARVKLKLEPLPTVMDQNDLAARVGKALQETLSFKAEVQMMPPGSLPRFEMKAKRFVKQMNSSTNATE
jgi:phenylacetate-CoA ligase